MTNAEKYLKPDMRVAMWKDYNQTGQKCKSIWQWLDQESKPTLTEDERVILRNLQNVRYIGRTSGTGYLYATFNTIDNYSNRNDITDIDLYFGDLFQFIKERRRIFNRGVVKK